MKLNNKQKRLFKEITDIWPKAKCVDPFLFLKYHNEIYPGYDNQCRIGQTRLCDDNLEYICYILPPGQGGTTKDMCCNGLRFGTNGDYISLPNIPSRIFNEI